MLVRAEAYGSVKQIFFEAWSVLTNLFSLKNVKIIKKYTKIKGFVCLGDVVTMRYGILLHKRNIKYLKLYTDVFVAFLLMLLSFF